MQPSLLPNACNWQPPQGDDTWISHANFSIDLLDCIPHLDVKHHLFPSESEHSKPIRVAASKTKILSFTWAKVLPSSPNRLRSWQVIFEVSVHVQHTDRLADLPDGVDTKEEDMVGVLVSKQHWMIVGMVPQSYHRSKLHGLKNSRKKSRLLSTFFQTLQWVQTASWTAGPMSKYRNRHPQGHQEEHPSRKQGCAKGMKFDEWHSGILQKKLVQIMEMRPYLSVFFLNSEPQTKSSRCRT